MMLSGHGLPEMPPGGSVERRLKSRMRRRLQFVDYGHLDVNNYAVAAYRNSPLEESNEGG